MQNNLTAANIITSELWDSLFPQKQRRILNMIISKIYYEKSTDHLSITLNSQGLEELALEF